MIFLASAICLALSPFLTPQGSIDPTMAMARKWIRDLGLNGQHVLNVRDAGDAMDSLVGPQVEVTTEDYQIAILKRDGRLFRLSNSAFQTGVSKGLYDFSKPLMPKSSWQRRVDEIAKLVCPTRTLDRSITKFFPDAQSNGHVDPAHYSQGGYLYFEGHQLSFSSIQISIDCRTGGITFIGCVDSCVAEKVFKRISATEARNWNGLVWNGVGAPQEPQLVWFVPNGVWNSPNWRTPVPPFRARLGYMFALEDGSAVIDAETGHCIGGHKGAMRSLSASTHAEPKRGAYRFKKKPGKS